MPRVPCPHSDDLATCATCAPTRTDAGLADAPTHIRQQGPVVPAAPAPVAVDEPERTRVGRYLVLHVVGAGGMGVVYAAYDPVLDRKVAIKILRTAPGGSKDTGGATRLLREAQAMAQLAHPNVVPVYDVGALEESVFVAMELVPGTTLNQWLKVGVRGWRQVVALLLDAARGLAAAHAAGLVHRDFKPTNVLVGEDRRVRITDFGLARSTRSTSSDDHHPHTAQTSSLPIDTPITRAGAIMGSPGYMAPEQYDGASTSAATDQYAFCVTLYEALYGTRPFPGSDLSTLARATREGAVPPPPREARVPGWLFPVIARGLSPDPVKRHASMTALITALENDPARRRNLWVAGVTTLALASLSVFGWAWLSSRTSRACQISASAQLAGVWDDEVRARVEQGFLATGRSWAPEAWSRTRQSVDAWVVEWTTRRADACEATRVRGEQSERNLALRVACFDRHLAELRTLGQALSSLTPERASQASAAVNRLSPLSTCANVKALDERARLPQDSQRAVDELEQRVAAGRVLLATGRLDDARRKLEPAAEDSVKLGIAAWETAAWEALAELELTGTRLEPCRRALEHATRVALAAGDDAAAVRSLSSLVSLIGWRLERPAEALQLAEFARGLLARLGGDAKLEAGLSEAVGDVLWQTGERGRALEHYRAALKGALVVEGHETVDSARLRSSAGWVLVEQGHLTQARAEFEAAQAIREELFGELHPSLTDSWNELSTLATSEGDYALATDYSRKALEQQQLLLEPGSFTIARGMTNLAEVLAQADQPEEAATWLARAEALADPRPTSRVQLMLVRALIAAARQQLGDALGLARKAEHEAARLLSADHELVAAALTIELGALTASGRAAEALQVSAQLVPLQVRLGHSATQEGVRALLNTARAQRSLARLSEALATLEQTQIALNNLEKNDLLRAQTALELATTLGALNRDLSRARALAEQSRELFVRLKRQGDADRADTWLKDHPVR